MRIRKPDVLAEITRHRAAVIEAHAGTGKTYTIEHLVVDLVLSGTSMEDLLVVTYTDKAARELKERVRNIIERLLYEPERMRSADGNEPAWVLGEDERTLLRRALFSYELAQISTIHSFCQRLLKETSFLSGGRMARTLVSGDEVFERAFAEVFRDTIAVDDELRILVEFWVADAGGELESLYRLMKKALSLGVGKEPAMARFPESSLIPAAEVSRRLEELRATLSKMAPKLEPAKLKLVRNVMGHVFIAGGAFKDAKKSFDSWLPILNADPVPSDERGLLTFLERAAVGLGKALESIEEKHISDACAAGVWDELEPWFRFLWNDLPTARERLAARLLPPIRARMERLKAQEGFFDFDDLLGDVAQALRHDSGRFTEALRSRFKVAIIDEFQDTDPIQWFIFRKAFFESGEHRLYLVGDPKQAIYGFRGADVRTYLQACAEVMTGATAGEEPLIRLDRNFRSTREIIAGYNAIFSARGTFFQRGGIHYRHPVACGQPEGLRLVGARGERSEKAIRLIHISDEQGLDVPTFRASLLAAVVEEINALVPQDGSPPQLLLGKGEPRPFSHADIFVLVRSNPEAAEVASTLRVHGIPCTLFQTESVFATEEALELEAVLESVLDPKSEGKVARALLTRFFDLRLEEVARMGVEASQNQAVALLRQWHVAAQEESVPRLLGRVISESGVLRRELALSVSERSLTNYLHLVEILIRWHAATKAELRDIVIRLKRARARLSHEDSEEVQRLETDKRAVQILTMHKSKGLEAAAVFVCGGFSQTPSSDWDAVDREDEEGRFRLVSEGGHPRHKAALAEASAAEEERLLYVALTRPTHLLYLPYFRDGEVSLRGSSIYQRLCLRLRELVEDLGGGSEEDRASFAAVSELRSYKSAQTLSQAKRRRWHELPQRHHALGPGAASEPLLAALPAEVQVAVEMLRRGHRAPGTTSYTRLKHGYVSEIADTLDELPVKAPETDAPRGAAFGICFHYCMEHLDLAALRAFESWEVWSATAEARALLVDAMRRNGIDERHFEPLARWVFGAARCVLGDSGLPAFCELDEVARELEFCFPWPEKFHGQSDTLWRVERGFVVGACDAVVRHEGRLWVLDWKTDLIPELTVEVARERYRADYFLQGLLYSLAACRLLGIASEEEFESSFGGLLYVFVRGPVVVAERPCWAELRAFEEELRGAPDMSWGRRHEA